MHTLIDPLRHAVRTGSRDLATMCGDVRLTFGETWDRCRRLAGALAALGMRRGDRVALLAANCHQYLEIYQAVPGAGFIIVPMNTRHAEPELLYALEDSGARLLITDRDPGALAGIVERVVRLPEEYEPLLAQAPESALGEGVAEDDVAGLFYTGGTTGASKGVMLTHRNLIANTWQWGNVAQLRPDDLTLVMAPLFHAAGTNGVLASVWTRSVQLVLPAFDPVSVLDLIEGERVTQTLAVPTMLAAMTDEQLARPRDVSSLRMLSHGASPIASELVRRAHQAFPAAELIHLYGTTETGPLATALRHEERIIDTELGPSCGQPMAGVQVRICDGEGREAPPGEVNEVVIRSPSVMSGYWNKPEQTAQALRDGWYWSGDLGYANEDGYIFLVDRKKDMIVTGGENVYCTEVEEVLYRHPAVLEAAVFGVPDERWGEAVHAVVVPRHEVEAAELLDFCRGEIADYKLPRQIELRAEPLPKSGPGKVLKRELRAPFWEGHETQVS